jgi:hypothetical protein
MAIRMPMIAMGIRAGRPESGGGAYVNMSQVETVMAIILVLIEAELNSIILPVESFFFIDLFLS